MVSVWQISLHGYIVPLIRLKRGDGAGWLLQAKVENDGYVLELPENSTDGVEVRILLPGLHLELQEVGYGMYPWSAGEPLAV